MKNLNSYNELLEGLKDKEKAYLLLYKKGSEKSDCAYDNFISAVDGMEGIEFFSADVNNVRDIHPEYGITSAPALIEFENGAYKNVIKGCHDTKQFKAIFEDAVYYASVKGDDKPSKSVTVYSTPTCSWCNTLKSHLKMHKIRFTDIDISKDQNAADELVRRSGQMGVPQTDIDGEIIVGFDKKRINELLEIKG